MRIAFVAWHGTPHTRRWVTFFAERGHEVHVVTCGDGDLVDVDAGGKPLPRPYEVHDLGPPRLGKLGYFAKIARARRTVRRLSPDVVHAHYATSYGMLATLAGRHPLVVTSHGDDVLVAPRSRLPRLVVRYVLRRADLITVPGDHMVSVVEALTAPLEKRILSFQYGVEVDRLAAVAEDVRAARAAGPIRVVCVRQLWRLYRVDLLIQAVAHLRSEGVDVECDIAGDGEERAALESLTRELALEDRVRFHGYVQPAQAERLLASGDVYVSTSETDGLSVSLLEALALGVVPVLADIPANRGWIEDGVSGVLVDHSADAVARAIVTAAGLDRETAVRINRATVRERADRTTNLERLESALEAL